MTTWTRNLTPRVRQAVTLVERPVLPPLDPPNTERVVDTPSAFMQTGPGRRKPVRARPAPTG